MRNRGDPFTGVRSASIIAKGQPCPPAPPLHPPVLRPAVPGFSSVLRALLLHLRVRVSFSSLQLLLLHLTLPVVLPRLSLQSPRLPVPESVPSLRSFPSRQTVPVLAPAYHAPLLRLGSPVFSSPLPLPGRRVSQSVVPEPLADRQAQAEQHPEAQLEQIEVSRSPRGRDPQSRVVYRSVISFRHDVQDRCVSLVPHEPHVPRVPQLEAFRSGHLRFGITALCMSRRSRG
jgi:hypothetical protein